MNHSAFIGTNIDIAASLLKKGEAVAIPTETVYGLAANALNTEAVAKIFKIKQRPTFDPLIIHLPSFDRVIDYVQEVPPIFYQIAKDFCPGPVTFLMKKKDIVPDLVTSGSPFVAIRIPSHPLTLALLNKIDFPLAAPSANPFGYISPTAAQHVADQLGHKIYYILDGGSCDIGLESTIIGVNDAGVLEIYRKGGLSIDKFKKYTHNIVVRETSTSNPEAPGMLSSHYAPKIPLKIVDFSQVNTHEPIERIGVIAFKNFLPNVATKNQVVLSPSGNYMDAARNLFAGMRYLDNCDLDEIWVELAPEEDLGIAINDRLRRAAHIGH